MVAKDLRTGQTWQQFRGEFGPQPPFPTGPDSVLIAYYASAELGCFRALGWQFPTFVLDLFTEFRALTNGRNTPNGASLLGALTYFGLDGIDASEKQDLRTLILSGGPWSAEEREAILRILSRATFWRWNACCPSCCRISTYRGRCCAGAS